MTRKNVDPNKADIRRRVPVDDRVDFSRVSLLSVLFVLRNENVWAFFGSIERIDAVDEKRSSAPISGLRGIIK